MPHFEYRLATPADDSDLRRMLREHPFPGRIQVTFEREPDFFLGARVEGPFHQTTIVRDTRTGQLVAMLSRSMREVYCNGEVEPLGYLSQLRVEPDYRALRHGIHQMGKLMAQLDEDGRARVYLISVIQDNTPARRFLTSRLAGMPRMVEYARYHTLALHTRRARPALPLPRRLQLVPGSLQHVQVILDCLERNGRRYQFTPRWTVDTLFNPAHTPGLCPHDFWLALDGARAVGCVALWDQSAFKQTIVHGYAGWLGALRVPLNAVSWLMGLPRLPAPHQPFRYCFASHLAVDDDNADVFSALLRQVYNLAVARGDSYLMLGLAERHRFFPLACANYPHIDYPSQLYLTGWQDVQPLIERLDDRPTGIETGVL